MVTISDISMTFALFAATVFMEMRYVSGCEYTFDTYPKHGT
jgi:hypothetical protein